MEVVPRYKRVLLKLSGEVLAGPKGFGIHPATSRALAAEVVEARRLGTQIGIVIGGGNFWRGLSDIGRNFDRVVSDKIGMLATVINALVFQEELEKQGVDTAVMTAVPMSDFGEPFTQRGAISHLERGSVVLFASGTGHPYFSTDMAAALRALECSAELLIKGTKVDGVFTADPVKDSSAVRLERVSFREVLEKGLFVLDATAVALCMQNGLPVRVIDILKQGNLVRLMHGDEVGTLIS